MAAYPLLDMLPQPDVADTLHAIITCLSAVAKRWVLARGVLKMLWIMLQDRNLVDYLHSSSVDLLRNSAVDGWSPNCHRLFTSCMYPKYAAIGQYGRELADMGELLEEWPRLSIVKEKRSASQTTA